MFKKVFILVALAISLVSSQELSLSDLQKLSELKKNMNISQDMSKIVKKDTNTTISNDIEIKDANTTTSNDIEIKDANTTTSNDIEIKDITDKEKNPFKYKRKDLILNQTYKKQTKLDKKTIVKYGSQFFTNKNFINQMKNKTSNNYLINCGDVISIIIYGVENKNFMLEVDKEGNIKIPSFGPLYVKNLKYKDFVNILTLKLEKSFKNSKVYVSLDSTSPIQITVSGNINSPGIYNISAQSTIKEALLASNGISDSGSYREIKLIRNNKQLITFDIYKLIKNGDNSYLDYVLMDGDVLVVGTIKKEVILEGEVYNSASFELKDNENLTALLYYANGIKPSANTSNIRIQRFVKNSGIKIIDLSSLKDTPLMNGDIITIFPINNIKTDAIYLNGNVVNPISKAFYKNQTLYDFFNEVTKANGLNGIFLENTNMDYAIIKRVDKTNLSKTVIGFSINDILNQKNNITLQASDEIYIFNKIELKENPYIYVNGTVVKGNHKHQFFEGLTLNDAFNFTEFKTETFSNSEASENHTIRSTVIVSNRVQLTRQNKDETKYFILDLNKDKNFPLEKYDEINFFNQTEIAKENYITIRGEVNFPGKYNIDSNTSIKDVLDMAGGLKDDAYLNRLEIASYKVENGVRKQTIKSYSLKDIINSNMLMKCYDEITIFKISNWDDTKIVTIHGEVKFPGKYVINKSDKISDIIKRAGGYTKDAYIEGSVFTREDVKKIEQKSIDDSIKKLKKNVMTIALSPPEAGENKEDKKALISLIDSLIIDLKQTKPIGRLSIRLSRDLTEFENSNYNIYLNNQDNIYIPRKNQTISVIGEVYNANTFIYIPNKDIDYYLTKSGGLTDDADKENIYIIHLNGDIQKYETGFLFNDDMSLLTGDTLVVPLKIKTTSNLSITKDISEVLYKLAVTVASLKTIGSI